jgi:hypothetical protein
VIVKHGDNVTFTLPSEHKSDAMQLRLSLSGSVFKRQRGILMQKARQEAFVAKTVHWI